MRRHIFKTVASLTAALCMSTSLLYAYGGDMNLKRMARSSLSGRKSLTDIPIKKAPARVTNGEKVILSAVLSKDSWIVNAHQEFGIYEYPLTSYNSTCLSQNADLDPTGGATYIGNGQYFTTSYDNIFGRLILSHYIIDTTTWTNIDSSQSMNAENIARDLAYDHTTGVMYGCFRGDGGEGYVLGTLDPHNTYVTRNAIAPISSEDPWNALGIDRYGNLYAISRNGLLYAVDKGTGAMTLIGDTGLKSKYQSTGAIDLETNLFYYAPCNDGHDGLYAVNLSDAKAEKLYEMADGEQLGGMYIPEASVSQTVPGIVTDLTADFDDLTLKGSVSFTAPACLENGTPASGALSYTIESNGMTLADGITAYGQKTETPVELDTPGEYTFIVTVSNSSGRSREAYISKYAGHDCPKAVEHVDITYGNGEFIISWPASTEPAHGGLFDKNDVGYTVKRYPGGDIVADNIKETSCRDAVNETSELIRYRYEVIPVHKGIQGKGVSSGEYLLGAITPPYEAMFTSEDALKDLSIIDANNDGRRWMMYADYDFLWLYPTSVTKGDDYIFSAPVRLETGRLYRFTAEMGVRYAEYGNKEVFEAILAKGPDTSGVIQTLIEPTTINTDRDKYNAVFRVKESGKYHFAIHGISEPDSYGLFAYGMSVTSDAPENAPDAPVLNALADRQGGMRVDVVLTAPDKLIKGDELTTIAKMELYRDEVIVKTFDNPAPGRTYEYTDNEVNEGLHRYRAIAYNGAGSGKAAETSAYAGINLSGAPRNAKAIEQNDNRTVIITWETPEKDIDGCPINPEFISYTVARYDDNSLKWIPAATGIKGNSYTETLRLPEPQLFIKYGVFAETAKGTNEKDVCAAPTIAVGDAYGMPYVETFGGTSLNGILGEENENDGASWQIWSQYDQDGDGYCLLYSGAIDKKGSMFTGKIHITGTSPKFSFYYWSIPTSPGEEIIVEVNDGTGFKEVGRTPLNRGGNEQHWEKFSCPLDEYAGKDIQVRLSYIIKKYVLYIDNLRIYNAYDDNLSIHSLQVPTKMDPGTINPITVTVANTGENMSRPYAIDLYRNEVKVDRLEMPALRPENKASRSFAYKARTIDAERPEFHVVIDYDDDFMDDNTSDKASTMILHRDYPVPTGLKGIREGNDVALEWIKPELDGGDITVTDGAERYVPFSIGSECSLLENDYIGDWTMYNGDYEGSNGLSGFPHDNIRTDSDLSFIIFNPAELGIVARDWQPRNGDQAFVCLCAPVSRNDDWMISPLLSGKSQTVKFYAKSAGAQYNEQFEFLYSATDKDVKHFIKIDGVSNVPANWTEYTFPVPDGAKYFAIRCVSDRQFALFVDDITFERANPAASLNLRGYNVYCDGENINAGPVSENVFRKTELDTHSYLVTAVYDKGESAPSNEVSVSKASSISGINAGSMSITGGNGHITVIGAEGKTIDIFTADGIRVKRLQGHEHTSIRINNGMYIVNVDGVKAKVIVK